MASLDFKVVLLGSQGVGKTSLVLRYVEGTFAERVPPTIGASFFTHKITVHGHRVKLQIWDTAGQERFRSMAPMYYRGASAAMLVYDITNAKSLAETREWVNELRANTDHDTLICLLANKCDQLKESDEELIGKGRDFADSIGALFYKTSAQANEGIDDAFLGVVQRLLVKGGVGSRGAEGSGAGGPGARGQRGSTSDGNVDVAQGADPNKKSSCC